MRVMCFLFSNKFYSPYCSPLVKRSLVFYAWVDSLLMPVTVFIVCFYRFLFGQGKVSRIVGEKSDILRLLISGRC